MREILFRAKMIATQSDWVEGFYNHIPCGRFMCDEHCIQTINEDGRIGQLYNVYKETVGQFTGLIDKNGKKIFEGDIIKTDNGRISAVSVVKYGDFRPKMIYDMFWNYTGQIPKQALHGVYCESSKEPMMLFNSPNCIEVIGNIHDNPELLEG